MKTNVYVDGFNLYYRVKSTPYRWLDIAKLCQNLLPQNSINRIRYFTARVIPPPSGPQQAQRQQIYLRALQTLPNLTVHYGHFLRHPVQMALVVPPPNGPHTVEVWKTEEKGSDVNLATYLLLDAFDDDYEAAVVISNDSDLQLPILMVRKRFDVKVVVLHPVRPARYGKKLTKSVVLAKAASKSIVIDDQALQNAQFPPVLYDKNGTITKPAGW